MRKITILFWIASTLISCREQNQKATFTVSGNISHAADQEVYLEQLFFSDRAPEIIDTATMRQGRFELNGSSPEEGMFRIRLEKQPAGFIFINDAAKIGFRADLDKIDLQTPDFQTPANRLLKSFITEISKRHLKLAEADSLLQVSSGGSSTDSTQRVSVADIQEMYADYHQFILGYIDTVSDPVVAMFALGYTQKADQEKLGKSIASLGGRFPGHQGIAAVINQYNTFVAQQKQRQQQEQAKRKSRPSIGDIAPDFTMNDTNGKPFSLSSLRGKYVLVDFWASWCGPCRHENPVVVSAFEKFNARNFTVLGVSLDEDKTDWLQAIKDDRLSWKQISDLKGWASGVAELYGFEAIPYNVLLDPSGKIIATELRGEALEQKLAEVIK